MRRFPAWLAEEVDKLNNADAICYQTEKTLAETFAAHSCPGARLVNGQSGG
jgi:hypothetical protein